MLEFTNPTKESAMGTATSIDPFDNPVIFGEIVDLLEPYSNQPE